MANRVCEILGIEKPVISAAMTWLTSAEFVAAVSEAGGAGVEAGGHASDYNVSLMSGFPAIRAAIEAPLMAAGWIIDASGAKAAAAMGAEGVYAGTRLIVTKENPTAEAVKQTLIETRAEDLIRVPDVPGVSYFVRNAVGLELEEMMRRLSTGIIWKEADFSRV